MNDVKEMTVERSRWVRGTGSNIEDAEVYMYQDEWPGLEGPCGCIFGFYAEACGADIKEVDGVMSPYHKPHLFPAWVTIKMGGDDEKYEYHNNSFLTQRIMEANDSRDLTDEDREAQIKQLFLESPSKVVINFVD
jgi:hypothetical protein